MLQELHTAQHKKKKNGTWRRIDGKVSIFVATICLLRWFVSGKVTLGDLSNQLDKNNGLGSSGSRSDQCNSFLPTDVWLAAGKGAYYGLLVFSLSVTAANDEGQSEGHDGRYPLIVERFADIFSFFLSSLTDIPSSNCQLITA